MSSQKLQMALKTVVNKAWDDDNFRAQLVENPHSAINSLGFNIPADFKLSVHDQTDADVVYLNIPNEETTKARVQESKNNMDDMELSDEQLELVSGGEIIFTASFVTGVVGAGIVGGGLLAGGFGVGWGVSELVKSDDW